MDNMPTGAEFKRFVETYERLLMFEMNQRTIRGHGAFKESELPVPGVAKVLDWLRGVIRRSDQVDILLASIKPETD